MAQLMNAPEAYVDEMLDGLVAAHPVLRRAGAGNRVVTLAQPAAGARVAVVSGGGSGHLPLFTGYVGAGLLDACAIGNVFEGPNVQSCMEAIQLADRGKGVLCLYGNYGGDRMNFDMAGEMLDGVETRTVLGTDDVASATLDRAGTRRGVAGIVFAYKIAGAAAATGKSLAEVAALAQRAVDRTKTIGFALSGTTLPGKSAPSFSLAAGEIEMGMGIHGEPGIWRDKLKPADALADEMLDRLLAEAPADGKRVAVLVNSLGATPLEELYILYRRLSAQLTARGYTIVLPLVGRYTTSMEMAGASVSLSFLDGELEPLMLAPADCPFWTVR
ncbi:MAG TPA: dihydroxyacetone kinase subunit DhaK [Reyranella sp.]